MIYLNILRKLAYCLVVQLLSLSYMLPVATGHRVMLSRVNSILFVSTHTSKGSLAACEQTEVYVTQPFKYTKVPPLISFGNVGTPKQK